MAKVYSPAVVKLAGKGDLKAGEKALELDGKNKRMGEAPGPIQEKKVSAPMKGTEKGKVSKD